MPSLIEDVTAGRGILLTEFRLLRQHRRVDAVLVMDRAVLVFGRDRAQTEAAAIDLADFHAGSAGVPILPVVIVDRQRVTAQRPLPLAGAAPAVLCTRLLLPGLLDQVARFPVVPGYDAASWQGAPYRPVPGLIEAACRLYADHDVAALGVAQGGRGDLERTKGAVRAILAEARAAGQRVVIFVTGVPGAGKTLCGLDIAFDPAAQATFLTGNPALVHVLRAALVSDAAARGLGRRAARQRVGAVIQPLHQVRDHHARNGAPPAERLVVIDEAQRCWTEAYARRKTAKRPETLTDSEPALLMDAMARHDGFAAIVCLVGGGQEIHAGEGGLASWGEALAARPHWHAAAAPATLTAADARQRLPPLPHLRLSPRLALETPVRAWRSPGMVAWIDAVLANDAAAARGLAAAGLPVRLTRSLAAMRTALRAAATGRPARRAGLVASSGAKRLRAEGLGGLLWHQDEDAIASWFLETWPDIRSSDALELAGTEFGVQGLELDHAGLCWDGDLVRSPDGTAWLARAFRATAWTVPSDPQTLSNRLNAYRVLLTRARRSTIIWVPPGDAADATREPARYDGVAFYLQSCGAIPLDAGFVSAEDRSKPPRTLL